MSKENMRHAKKTKQKSVSKIQTEDASLLLHHNIHTSAHSSSPVESFVAIKREI